MAGLSSLLLCQKLVYLIHAVAVYLLPFINFISINIFRLKLDGNVDHKINFHEAEPELSPEPKYVTEFRDFEEDEPNEIYLKFKFPTYGEFSNIQKETAGTTNNIPNIEVVPSGFEGFSGRNLEEAFTQTGGVHDKGKEILVVDVDENEKIGAKVEFTENSEEEPQRFEENEWFKGNSEFLDESQSSSSSEDEEKSGLTDPDWESTSFDHTHPVTNHLLDSHYDDFLSDGDFGGGSDVYSDLSGFEEKHDSSEDFSDEDIDIMGELENLEEHISNRQSFLSVKDFVESPDNTNDVEFAINHEKGVTEGYNIEKPMPNDSYEDPNELESLWEHQELIEQLKIELKKVRATGLPTILEESESPKLMDDLKPWKIDEFQRGDCLGELHKFYKSYRERMRKFDIINYQKMYAMGFLQLKDPLKSSSIQKPSPPTLKSLVAQNLWLFKHKIHGTDPMRKFIQELQGDLEAIYVGQMCLSWEFLHWQYDRALDLWDSDHRCTRRYNQVAGEFQQFQVLVQRFIEDEPFQGPRVQNYVKTRCAVRNLLQVPVVREDNLKDKRKAREKTTDEYVVSSDMLVETIEESIRIFWRFVRADKDCTTINGHRKMPELPSPEDLILLMEVKKNLQKKERKLKDMLRSDKCILRKFRQCREDDSEDQVLYFFSQVDMKLVCRVLNMSKITKEQLMWCDNKLSRINFVNRRINVEPGFLLFPC